VRRRAARLRSEDLPRPDGSVEWRRYHRPGARAAGHGRIRRRKDVPILRPRRDDAIGEGRLGPDVPGERLRNQAAAETDVRVEGLLQPGVVRDADQESGPTGG